MNQQTHYGEGVKYDCIHSITFNNEADIKAHVEFQACHLLKIKLPATAGKNNYPAIKLNKDAHGNLTSDEKRVQIRFNISGCRVVADFNGAALSGNIWMTTFGGNIEENGLGGVLLHELGHNMGQVYADKSADNTFGRPRAKAIPGINFPSAVPAGNVYGSHDHQGTHCAFGLSLATKLLGSYQHASAYTERKCIMFGGSDLQSKVEYDYCGDCRSFIKAEDLSDIRKSWR